MTTNFRELLDNAGINQRYFARLCGIKEETVSNWCLGKTPPKKWAIILVEFIRDSRNDLERNTEKLRKRLAV